MSHVPANRVSALKDRAAMLHAARHFFHSRDVLEVDCPILNACPAIDLHIAVIPATFAGSKRCYLHTSPEYGMKRLLSEGIGDIYQLSHVFRDGECGARHNPEFSMAEWYRVGWTLEQLQDETAEFIQLFIGEYPVERLSYRQALMDFAGVDCMQTSREELLTLLREAGIEGAIIDESKGLDDLLNLLLGVLVEPQLGRDKITILCDYPASQAELAQVTERDGVMVAERFEAYFQGLELCNGYHELLDADEQRERFESRNAQREAAGLPALPIDEAFLGALERGVPDSCGVAVGFDRLMMLRRGAENIREVVPFAWGEA